MRLKRSHGSDETASEDAVAAPLHRFEVGRSLANAATEGLTEDTDLIQTYFDQLNLSSSWFRKRFKERHGLAPMQYRQHRLHERAKKLLENTG